MIVYTFTANIDDDLADEWLQYVKNEVIPFVLNTSLIVENKIFKVLNDNEGHTYTFQFYFEDPVIYNQFFTNYHKQLATMLNKYAHPKVVYFNTLLKQL